MDPTTLFDTIHRPHCTISVNFYLYLQYFQQKVFNFSKITDPKRILRFKLKQCCKYEHHILLIKKKYEHHIPQYARLYLPGNGAVKVSHFTVNTQQPM